MWCVEYENLRRCHCLNYQLNKYLILNFTENQGTVGSEGAFRFVFTELVFRTHVAVTGFFEVQFL